MGQRELDRVRRIALALPGMNERLSHGVRCFFVRDQRPVCYYHDNHHGDGRISLWCPAPPGVQEELAGAEPKRFFKPPTSARGTFSGWLGVFLDTSGEDTVDWDEIAAILEDAYRHVAPGKLDRGSSMTSKPVTFLLADLGVTQSHSRPHVSNDNPYSEAQFKTLKYRPGFPRRFTSIEAARAHCQLFFPWYNEHHRHGGLGLHTAADVHHGQAPAVRARRADVLTAAYLAHPERFVRKPPAPRELPTASWINPPGKKEAAAQ